MSFLRTMAGAIGTSVATTSWLDGARAARASLVGGMNTGDAVTMLTGRGLSLEQVCAILAQLVDGEGTAIATNHLFMTSALIFFAAAGLIWASPAPRRVIAPGLAH